MARRPVGRGEAAPIHRNDYYDRHAYRYASDGLDAPPPLFDQFIRELPARGRVVDLGCGAGRLLARLAKEGLNPRGYDLSPTLAAIAKERSGVRVSVRDMRHVRLSAASLDGVLAVDSLLHLGADELAAMIGAVASWLRPGGLFLATMKVGRGTIVDAAGRRFLFVDPAGWRSALAAAGFEIVGVRQASAPGQVSGARHGGIATLARKPG